MNISVPSFRWPGNCPAGRRMAGLLALCLAGATASTWASLDTYDAAIRDDAAGGLIPVARLVSPATLTGANRVAFNFGTNSGDATTEFILEGNPAAIAASGYLAVGANTSSNLRYEQYNNTGQLGFTQLGVLDYQFSPPVPSPTSPTHVAYAWNATARSMKLYVNGTLAGTATEVSASFAMPTGQGWLGANSGGGEAMAGVIHRVTVYDDPVSPEVILAHADAFRGVVHPPIILSFQGNPDAIFTPGSATLTWDVRGATAVFLNGADVTAISNLTVFPNVTTTYTLTATNASASATAQATVRVNPAPVLQSFLANRTYVAAGDTFTLSWNVSFAQNLVLAPGPGDVMAQTVGGAGSVTVQAGVATNYVLTAGNEFGTNTATVAIHLVHPATHLVISEFMADDRSTWPDENGQFSGWIEIFNPTTAPVNLAGYFLTDNATDLTRWAFPEMPLTPGGYLVVFASGKDRAQAGAPLHTNFRLSNGGEYLSLVGPGPVVLHAFTPAFPLQRPDLSYGLLAGDVTLARYLGTPTPGAPNDDTLPPPWPVEFSRPGGVFTEPFQVALIAPDLATEIRFTVDGSTPGATNGARYSTPLQITNTTHLRAVALAADQASQISGASYLKLAPDLAGYTSSLPIMVIENFGAGAILQKGWNATGAGIKQVPRQTALWATFERTGGASALTNPPQMFNLIGIRGRGAYSSQWQQKPYSVEAMDEEGAEALVSPLGLPSHADWVLYFPDPDQSRDPALLFNTFAYELSQNMGRYGVRFRWVEAFINEDGGDLKLADRRGVYAIIEKVARGPDRLDFQKLTAAGSAGGWLLNINRMDPEPDTGWPAPNGALEPWFFHTAGPNRLLETAPNTAYNPVPGDDQPQQWNAFINFDNPNGYAINPNQRAAIEGWFKQFEDVLYNDALWRDRENGYRRYLDPVDFADYFILNVLTRNGDGLLLSMFPWKGDDGRLRMGPAWDYNWSSYYISGGPTGSLLYRSEYLWYPRLFADPDFAQLCVDRWWDLRRGPMSNAAMAAIIDSQAADISLEKSLLNGMPSTGEWTNRLGQMKTWLAQRADWIDGNYLRPPVFKQAGGEVPDGFLVVLTATNGTLYVTTDGSDPRAPGGAVAATALAYTGPIAIRAQTLVQARLKNGTSWSGLTAAVFYTPQDLTRLAVTEIMYNPPAAAGWTSDDLEFLELKNIGSNTLHLGTLAFTAGVTFAFTNGTDLGPGQFFVLARNAATFQSKYPGVAVRGVYTGKLDNGGETLRLASPTGGTIFDLTYNDRAPWPLAADGYGFSVVPRAAAAPDNSSHGAHWRASTAPGGSPGKDDPAPTLPAVVVNEILTHTDPLDVDAIELFNPTAQAADIGGWFLSDDGTTPAKFRIPDGTLLPPGGYRVLTEADFNPAAATLLNFALDSAGDAVYLTSADAAGHLTGYSHGVDFGAAALGVSFGRYLNSVGEEQFPAQQAITPGGPNAGPVVGPVVLTEIMYHPDADHEEFVELRNVTAAPVPLFDPANPTNTWRVNGLGFTFPTNLVLPANGLLLLVATNPSDFRARYGVPEGVQVLGLSGGTLQNSGERLELQRPDAPGTNGVPYITVDEVRYDNKVPWPPGADGGGPSLQRRAPSAYGNDPANWVAALPTPGADYLASDPPVVTRQPQSQTVVAYQDVTFAVSAVGATPLYFQWLFNGVPLAGATNGALLLTNVTPAQAGRYQAVVFNAAGSATSDAALLTTLLPALILQQPRSAVTNLGRTVSFAVAALGTGPLRYQWRFNGLPLANATNATLTLTNVQPVQAGFYAVIITDDIGPILSALARFDVLIDPFVVRSPLSQGVVAGATVTLSVAATNSATLPIGYRWLRNGISLAGASFLLNERMCFLTITNVQLPFTNYSVILTNAARPGGLISATATLSLLADTDHDGLPDAWETAHGLNPAQAADGTVDSDGDGMLNWQEYVAGTDPTNALSYLKLDATAGLAGLGAGLAFQAVSNKTYTIEYTDSLETVAWLRLADFAAQATNHLERLTDTAFRTNRYYRLLTPRRP